MKRALVAGSLWIALAGLASGCMTTREEGDALRRDMQELKAEVAQAQRQLSDGRTREKGRVDELAGAWPSSSRR